MGRWIEQAERPVSCVRCKARVETGERFWFAGKGKYMCELCGSMAEHEEPEVGKIEAGVRRDIESLPAAAADGTLAELMIGLARKLDNTDMADRDYPVMAKELRQTFIQLKGEFPPDDEDDETTQARKRRERYLMDDYDG